MPLTPTKITQRQNTCTLEYAGETVHLAYYPAAISATHADTLRDWIARANAATGDDEKGILSEFGAWIATFLASWDYVESVDEDGTPGPMVPITAESLAVQLVTFTDFMLMVVVTIIQDFQQGNAIGTPPPAPSDATS